MKKLDAEMKKTDLLLYQMIPKKIADRLRSGEKAANLCEVRNICIYFSFFFLKTKSNHKRYLLKKILSLILLANRWECRPLLFIEKNIFFSLLIFILDI